MKPWLAIVNPRAGGGIDRRAVLERLERRSAEVVFTERSGHATELAREASRYEGVIAAGGDGTLHEVLRGLERSRTAISILPVGRGNSLARDLAARKAARQRIDLIQADVHTNGGSATFLCASTIAIGYAAEVADLASRRLRWFGGRSYPTAAAVHIPRKRSLSIEGVERQTTGWIASNTRHAASFVAFPGADCADGSFEAVTLDARYLPQARHNWKALRGSNGGPTPVNRLTAIEVRMGCPEILLLDGEFVPGVTALRLQMLPGALEVELLQ